MRNLHDLIVRDKYDAGGKCDESKGNVIRQLVLKTGAQLCVELGVFKGSSLMYFAEALEVTGGRVIGIDPYLMSSLKNEIPDKSTNTYIYDELFKDQTILDNLYDTLATTIVKNNLAGVISLVRTKSEDYSDRIKKESVDVIHIDGNHDEECVTRDVFLYLPLIKVGGYIIMDDISWPGVKAAINMYLNPFCSLVEQYADFSVHIKN